ncbi:MAG: ribosome maturation factor RimM [Nocardioidaceae bacterium]
MEVVVGRIGRAHGIRGEVGVEIRTDEPQRRFRPGAVLRPDPSSRPTLTVRASRPHGERLLIAFHEVPDRTSAETLRGAMLLVDVDEEESPEDPEEFYDRQLVGLVVRPSAGGVLGAPSGEVTEVLHLPVQDVLLVRTVDGREAMVPFVAALVPEVDVAAGHVVVRDLPGLLEPPESERPESGQL